MCYNCTQINKTCLWSKLCFVQLLYCSAAPQPQVGGSGFKRQMWGEHTEELHPRLKAETLFLQTPFINNFGSNANKSKRRPETDTCVQILSRNKHRPQIKKFAENGERFKGSVPTWCTELTASKCGGPIFPSAYRWREHLKAQTQTRI